MKTPEYFDIQAKRIARAKIAQCSLIIQNGIMDDSISLQELQQQGEELTTAINVLVRLQR
jgi:hypothetical protein